MKKRVRIYMVQPAINNIFDLMDTLKLDGDEPYELIWDNEHPDYLIGTELIYENIACYDEFMRLYSQSTIAIYIAGECIAPDLNIFDYAICFDKNLKCDDRIGRIPTRIFFRDYIPETKNEIMTVENARKELDKKVGFCNFIYSNPYGAKERTDIFHILSEYKKVDSWGKYLNNVDESLRLASSEMGWPAESVAIKSRYKFSIAFENASYVGYTSEKLYTSLIAHTIPIYWGNVNVTEEVNEKAIINCHNYASFGEVLNEIRKIDENDDLWIEKIRQPWLTDTQEQAEKNDILRYKNFLEKIFMQPIHKAARKGRGFHPEEYKKWFFKDNSQVAKIMKNHDVELAWLKKIYSKDSCVGYFVKNHLHKVAIYGIGDLGRFLYTELSESEEIEVVCLIDKNSPRNVPVELLCKPENIKNEEEIEVIVVTLPHLFEQVRNVLREYTSCNIISIEELVR